MTRDRHILYTAAFLRAVATGMSGVLTGIYLARLRFDPAQIGLVVSSGLAGAAVAALLVTLAGDRVGRRRTLVALALLGAAGVGATAIASNVTVMAVTGAPR
ncbi:MAG: MFS transporter [Candidatus Eisenbacteria bacterium]|nr:MFS transporter [Candidatus Eisenbacteria bacterium]